MILCHPNLITLSLLLRQLCLFSALLLWLTPGAARAQQPPRLALKASIDRERATIGSELTLSIAVTNTGREAVSGLVVQDSLSAALSVQPGSVTTPDGTTFSAPTAPKQTGSWTVGRLDPGQTLTLRFRVIVTGFGVVYHLASVPGIVSRTCATVPVLVCSGDEYAFELTAPTNTGDYGWERQFGGNTSLIPNQREKTLIVDSPGAYRSVLIVGQPCADGACCPFVVEPVADVPVYSLAGTSPTCSGLVALANGNLRLAGPVSTTGLTFQLAAGGSSFETGSLLTPRPQPIPATGLLSINLTAGTYRVRVFNAAGCFRDGTTAVTPANCLDCPPDKCAPFVIRQTKRTGRVGSR